MFSSKVWKYERIALRSSDMVDLLIHQIDEGVVVREQDCLEGIGIPSEFGFSHTHNLFQGIHGREQTHWSNTQIGLIGGSHWRVFVSG